MKANKVMRVGNLKELRNICDLFQLMHEKKSHHAMTLSKTDAIQACNTLRLLQGSRLEMIEKISCAFLNPNSAIDYECIFLVDKEYSNNDDYNS